MSSGSSKYPPRVYSRSNGRNRSGSGEAPIHLASINKSAMFKLTGLNGSDSRKVGGWVDHCGRNRK